MCWDNASCRRFAADQLRLFMGACLYFILYACDVALQLTPLRFYSNIVDVHEAGAEVPWGPGTLVVSASELGTGRHAEPGLAESPGEASRDLLHRVAPNGNIRVLSGPEVVSGTRLSVQPVA